MLFSKLTRYISIDEGILYVFNKERRKTEEQAPFYKIRSVTNINRLIKIYLSVLFLKNLQGKNAIYFNLKLYNFN